MYRIFLILITLAFLSPVSAESADDFFARVLEFDKAVAAAESVDQVYPLVTKYSKERIEKMDKAGREKVLMFLQLAVEMQPEGMKVLESKIGAEQAALTVGVKEEGMSMTREVEFRKEGGAWKTDLGGLLDSLNK